MATRLVASVAGRSSSTTRFKSPPVRKAVPLTARHVAKVVTRPAAKLAALPAAEPVARPAAAPGLRLVAARTGDHGIIHQLLLSVFHGPSPAEFHAQLDEPGYEAADRLVVKDESDIAAHLRLARQTIQLGAATAPVVRFMDLATAPEYRGRGLATALLSAGERAARERGALVALTRTKVPALFARQGWSVCGEHHFSTAAPRAVLAELSVQNGQAGDEPPATILLRPRAEQISVRPLRRIELEAVVRLYSENLAGRFGWPVRSEAYWEWLLARQSCDRIFIAAQEGETGSIAEMLASIVGYAFVRQARIAELVTCTQQTAAAREEIARQLVSRVCADACEHSDVHLRCDVEAQHPLHELLSRAGGTRTLARELYGEVFMAKLLDPLAAFRQLVGEFTSRARAEEFLPAELGVELRSANAATGKSGVVERYRLQITKRGATLETGFPSRHALVLRDADLAPLLLGYASAADLAAAGRLRFTTATAEGLASCLFPATGWHRPALDDLLA